MAKRRKEAESTEAPKKRKAAAKADPPPPPRSSGKVEAKPAKPAEATAVEPEVVHAEPVFAAPAKAAAKAKRAPRRTGRGRTSSTEPAPISQGAREADEEGGGGGGEDVEPVVDAAAEIVDETEEGTPIADEEDPFAPRPQEAEAEEEAPAPAAAREKVALGRHDPLQAYLREVQKHPLLTPDEEHDLAVKYATTQDVDAAARLVTANLRLVVKIAYEYRRAYKNIMDLIQEGNIGLMQAVKKYDPNRGVKLSSYSAWWIRAYILRYIINNWRLVKLGTTQAQRKLFFNLNKEKAKLAAMGIDPTPAEVAKRLGVEEQEAVDMDRRLSSGEMSLDAPVGDNEGRPVARIELLPSSHLGPDAMVADEEMQDIVRAKLEEFRQTLKGKDIAIFDKRLMADEPLTLQELGDQFGISRERVRQIEARLTMNLRQFLKDALGDAVTSPLARSAARIGRSERPVRVTSAPSRGLRRARSRR